MCEKAFGVNAAVLTSGEHSVGLNTITEGDWLSIRQGGTTVAEFRLEPGGRLMVRAWTGAGNEPTFEGEVKIGGQ